MRCLWITLVDPEPRHNGQLIYSGGLIGGAAQAGMEIEIIGLAREGRVRPLGQQQGNCTWWLADHKLRSRLLSLVSPLPHMASRARSRLLDQLLQERLQQSWDAIVFDGISAGWALNAVLKRYPAKGKRPRLVYISHNHERSLREEVARNHPLAPVRVALHCDAWKVSTLERRLVGAVDLVTAITAEDKARYAEDSAHATVAVLPPGYDGPSLARRRIDQALPRRAVVVGSFDWIAKQLNLSEFLAVADPLFAAAGAQLQIVGNGDAAFLDRMRSTTLATDLTGTVGDVSSFMQQARVALVPERHGGGFKLKVLDYVFGRIPVLAIEGSVAGMPLSRGGSILYFRDHLALARGALRVIDDFERLNDLQDNAYNQCQERFSWRRRGEELRDMLTVA